MGIILYMEPEKVNDAVAFYKTAFDAVEDLQCSPFYEAEVIIGGTRYYLMHRQHPSDP